MSHSSVLMREIEVVLPLDGGYAWLVVLASFMINFVIDGIIYSYGIMANPLSEDLHSTLSALSIIGSAQMGLYYLCGPLTSAFVNRFGFRKVVFCGAVTTCIGILIASFLKSYVGVVICYGFIAGLGFGIMFPPTVIILGYYFEKYRAIAAGISLAGSSVGVLCAAPLFTYIMSTYGWEITMQVQAAALLICMLSSIAYRPLEPTKVMLPQEYGKQIDHSSVESSVGIVQLYDNLVPKMSVMSRKAPNFSDGSIIADVDNNEQDRPKTFPSRTPYVKYGSKQRKPHSFHSGPLDRKDIFYSANLKQLPEYQAEKAKQKAQNLKIPSFGYHLSMTKVSSDTGMTSEDESDQKKCCNVSHMIKSALKRLFDVSILKSVAFCVFGLSNFFYVFALYIPYVFSEEKAILNEIDTEYLAYFIPAIAVGNGIGRISSGAICSLVPKINPCYLVGFPTIFGGTITILIAFVLKSNEYFQLSFYFLLGFCIAFMITMRPIVIVYLLSLDKLTNAYGLNMMTMGLSGLLGVPIATIISEATGTFRYSFLFAGICFIISGALMISTFYIHTWKQGKH